MKKILITSVLLLVLLTGCKQMGSDVLGLGKGGGEVAEIEITYSYFVGWDTVATTEVGTQTYTMKEGDSIEVGDSMGVVISLRKIEDDKVYLRINQPMRVSPDSAQRGRSMMDFEIPLQGEVIRLSTYSEDYEEIFDIYLESIE